MRLDVFLPMLRRPAPDRPERPRGLLVRLARRALPRSFFSDNQTKRRGQIRRLLRRLGPTWLASPLRRIVQAVCFVAFLWLFCYVCFPYTARPARVWTGWSVSKYDAQAGLLTLASAAPPFEPLDAGAIVYAVDEIAEPAEPPLGRFRIVAARGAVVTLKPLDPHTQMHDQVHELKGRSVWALHEAPPGAWPSHYSDALTAKQHGVAAELFLIIDPLVSLSTAVAARSWVWSLTAAGVILAVCVLIPRGFCGYLCPLGTLIDLFDWSVGKRITRFRVADDGWWVHLKYYLLLGVLLAACGGVLLSGFVAAIPVITRGLLFTIAPLETGFARGWHQVPPMNAGHWLSLGLFAAVLGLGLLKPRFWCKYVCPSGAVFSLGNLFRVSERKVESSCIHCNKCVEICPFDAIKPDFTTRTTDCTLCQTCGGVCPTHAIKFVERNNLVQLKLENDPPTGETPLGRRGFLSAAAGTAAAAFGAAAGVVGVGRAAGARLDRPDGWRPVRPPGSVPEPDFLQQCIRCGECFQACPNDVLQPLGFEQGLEGLWTPHVVADWSGCEASCNACTQVCPTGAIRAIPLEEKRVARMGLAIVNQETCLPFAGREACQLCVDECDAAGYHAIEFTQVHTEVDEDGEPVEGTGYLAPVVREDLCVGCGLCQTRCYAINVQERGVLDESAIVIRAGAGREDRLRTGSYRELREREAAARAAEQEKLRQRTGGGYLPAFLQE